MNLPSLRNWKLLTFALVSGLWITGTCYADTYTQWATRVFTAQEQADPAISGKEANPAGDGVSNLQKFAFDLDPHTNSVTGLPTVGMFNDYNYVTDLYEPFVTITFRYPSTYTPENITYVPEVTADLRAADGWLRGPSVIDYYDVQ